MQLAVAKEASYGAGIGAGDTLHEVTCKSGARITPDTETADSEVELEKFVKPGTYRTFKGGSIDMPIEHYLPPVTAGYWLLHENALMGQWTPTKLEAVGLSAVAAGNKLVSDAVDVSGMLKGQSIRVYTGTLAKIYHLSADSTATDIPVEEPVVETPNAPGYTIYFRRLANGVLDSSLFAEGIVRQQSRRFHAKGVAYSQMQLDHNGNSFVSAQFSGLSDTCDLVEGSASGSAWADSGYEHPLIAGTPGSSQVWLSESGNNVVDLYSFNMTVNNGRERGRQDLAGTKRGIDPGFMSISGSIELGFDPALYDNYDTEGDTLSIRIMDTAANGDRLVTYIPKATLTSFETSDQSGKQYTTISANWEARPDENGRLFEMVLLPHAVPA